MRSCWGSWSYQCGTMVGTMAHHRIGWVIFRKDFEEFLNCFVETDVVWWLIWINRRTSKMGSKSPPRMLEQPGHGLHFGRSGTIRRIRCTFGSLTTSFHLSSRCGTWVVHWSLWFLEVSPWSILGLEMTGVSWTLHVDRCRCVKAFIPWMAKRCWPQTPASHGQKANQHETNTGAATWIDMLNPLLWVDCIVLDEMTHIMGGASNLKGTI